MRHHLPKPALSLVAFALGCGAVAVLEDGGGGADGDSAQCASVAQCCLRACSFAASLPCFDGDDECKCGEGDVDLPSCERAWLEFMDCALPQVEEALQCNLGEPALNCAVCRTERELVTQECGPEMRCFDP